MPDSLFISYSRVDGAAFALRLKEALRADPRGFVPWLDQHDLRAGRRWRSQLRGAIQACEALLFVASRDSVEEGSGCTDELDDAIMYKKPIVPLLLDHEIKLPYGLQGLEYIDFTRDFEPALGKLCDHLMWLASPAGQLRRLEDRLADARRDLRRIAEGETAKRDRTQADIALLEQQIAELQSAVRDPDGAAARLESDIRRDLEAERAVRPPAPAVGVRRCINPPPTVSPAYFQNRTDETRLVGEWLRDDNVRLIWVVGRGGVGKTTLACRLLRSLEAGELPDGGGAIQADGVVYLCAAGSRPITFQNFVTDLCNFLSPDSAREVLSFHNDPATSSEATIRAFLQHAAGLRLVVLLDGFEGVVNSASRTTKPELATSLGELLRAPHHGVKVVVTTRLVPSDLPRIEPGRQPRLDLDEGLDSSHAEKMLRALDPDGKVGLRDAPSELLDEARVRTRGFPKALVTLFGILSADRDTSLREILSGTAGRLPEEVLAALVGEAFGRLDPDAKGVMQALAVYGRPIPAVAVNFLLQPYLGQDVKPVLGRLVNMKLLHKEGDRYSLHPVDREYVFSLILPGGAADRKPRSRRFTRSALFHRAADWYRQARKPAADLRVDDLDALKAEFDLRCAGQEFDEAARLLDEVEAAHVRLGGRLQELIRFRERLVGNLTEPALSRRNAGRLGQLYRSVGQTRKAIGLLEDAVRAAKAVPDPRSASLWLGELAHCRKVLGETARAVELCEEALTLSKEVSDPQLRCNLRGFRGHLHGSVGEPELAIRCYEEALEMARENGNPEWACANLNGLAHSHYCLGRILEARAYAEQALEVSSEHSLRLWLSVNLSALSSCLADLGEMARAIECLRMALRIARETGQRLLEAYRLLMLALALVGEGALTEALALASESEAMTHDVEQPQLPSYCSFALAQIHFHQGNLAAARAAAGAAGAGPFPESVLHGASVLLGIVAFKQGDQAVARSAFERAVVTADDTLARNPRNPNALDCKGLACTGLLACGVQEMLQPALDAYRAARALNSYPGLVRSVSRWLDALLGPGPAPEFEAIRRAAVGG